jgi:hypothetical protein
MAPAKPRAGRESASAQEPAATRVVSPLLSEDVQATCDRSGAERILPQMSEVAIGPMSSHEPIDQGFLLRELRELLPGPVREATQLDGLIALIGGDPGEIIGRVNGNKLTVAAFSVRWEGPHTPVVRPKHFATLSWKRVPASTLLMTLHGLVRGVCEVRKATYRRCERCRETKPLEWMHHEKTCRSCAERHPDVVH